MAASLELYLGSDVLVHNGRQSPVQWRGYSQAVGKYQGEVLNKKEIQEAFRAKLVRCKASRESHEQAEWSGLKAIWKAIFAAFH
jgi:hypothetical protein